MHELMFFLQRIEPLVFVGLSILLYFYGKKVQKDSQNTPRVFHKCKYCSVQLSYSNSSLICRDPKDNQRA